jgi:genome maintenance exonuclease 1
LKQFNHIKLPELQFDLESETTEQGRKYFLPDGRKYDSVTTILSHNKDKTFLDNWRERIGIDEANKITKKSSNRGTKLHSVCEKYLLNELTDMKIRMMMPDIKDFFTQLRPHIDQNIDNIYGLEQSLYSDKYRMAGRSDTIAEWSGKISIIDYKNSIREKKEEWIQDYFIQCTAYATMFTEITSLPIEQIVVLIANEEGTPQVFIRKVDKYFISFEKIVEDYHKSKLVVL